MNAGQVANRRRLALEAMLFVPVLWTLNVVIARKASGVVEPYTLALGRWLMAALILFALTRRELWAQRAELARHWWHFVVLGFFGMLVCGAWVYLAARTTQAMNISLIYAASPVLIALGSALWLGERMRAVQAAGVALALAGVVHVVVKGQWGVLAQVQWVVGDLWMVAATVAWAAYALLLKYWHSPLGSTAQLAAIAAGGALTLLPGALWESQQPGYPPLDGAVLQLMLLAALGPGVVAYWLYGWAQKVLGANRVAVTMYLNPLYSAVAAFWVLGEPMGTHHLLGAALILSGVFLVSLRPGSE